MKQKRIAIQVDTSRNAWMGGQKRGNDMIKMLKISIGWRGTWHWACRQMSEGKTVYRLRDSGVVKFTYNEAKRKIVALIWWETSTDPHEWGISIEDVFATDFNVLPERPQYPQLHYQSQMKSTD